MKRLSLLTLAFAVLTLVFFNLLVFFRIPFPPYPLMNWQDALDVLTPFVLLPVYWLLFRFAARERPGLGVEIVFVLLGVLWVQGQGLHLGANAIDNLIEGLAENGVMDLQPTDVYRLTYFFDEELSHYLWYGGVVGLAALLIAREWRCPAGETPLWWAIVLGGLICGFSFFATFLEGQAVPLGLPFTVLVVVAGLAGGRGRLATRPMLAFFFAACLLAALLFAGWGLYWRGFPEFTEVGLL
jgi:hypothetical protein